jgi:hypothetical protein
LTNAWMPAVRHIRATIDGGSLKGGAPRVVWESLGADPREVSAVSAAQRLIQLGRPSHLTWNPLTGEIVQLISILRAACSLGWPEGLQRSPRPGPAESGAAADHPDRIRPKPANDLLASVNAEGRLCVQIAVVAFAQKPFTCGPLAGLEKIIDWLDSWSISPDWPAGGPAPFPHSLASPRSRRLWARGGHFGASQVPGSPAVGPGGVDVDRLTGQAAYAAARARRSAAICPGSPVGYCRLKDHRGVFAGRAQAPALSAAS